MLDEEKIQSVVGKSKSLGSGWVNGEYRCSKFHVRAWKYFDIL